MGNCVICHADCGQDLCEDCGRNYDRTAHDDATILRAMEWAADRAVRMRGATRRRGTMVAISFTADELVMLRDRVSAGAEVSEETGWDDLLAKVKAAQAKLGGRA